MRGVWMGWRVEWPYTFLGRAGDVVTEDVVTWVPLIEVALILNGDEVVVPPPPTPPPPDPVPPAPDVLTMPWLKDSVVAELEIAPVKIHKRR